MRVCTFSGLVTGQDGRERCAALSAESQGITPSNNPPTQHVNFASAVAASPNFVAIASTDGHLSYVNDAGRALLGLGPEDAISGSMTDLFPADDLPFVREVAVTELSRKHRWSGPLRLARHDAGAPVAVDLTIYHLYESDGGTEPAGIAFVATDVTERRRAEQRTRALLDTGSTLTDMSDAKRTFADLAELIVRTMATLCVVDLFSETPDGVKELERVGTFHIDRRWRHASAAITTFAPSAADTLHPVRRLMHDGQSTLVTMIDDAWIDGHATSPAHAAMIREMRLHSLITVPLVAGGEIVGALTCSLGAEAVPRTTIPLSYDAEDLFFLEEIGRRAGRSIETARLYERERRIAETLQAASLPQVLPSNDRIHIDAEYRPGSTEATIGGDWFDAFVLRDGRVVLTVGDVLGHGLHAAVTMTKLRQAMQSAAMVNAEPNVMLDVADATLRLHAAESYATAIAAVYDPAAHVTTIASAGHPGPMLRSVDGFISEHSPPGLLLGLRDGTDDAVRLIATPPGSLLVFFTDGLTEATRDVDEGMRRMHEALAAPGVVGDARPARAIVESVLRGKDAGDDTAVLTLQVR